MNGQSMIHFYAINGTILPKEEAALQITDLAILRGYGLFDFFIVKQGKPLFFEDYLDRFEHSARVMSLPIPMTRDELRQHVLETIAVNQVERAGVKLILTGGYADDGYTPADPNLLVLVAPPPQYPAAYYEQGVKLILHEYQRTLPHVKSTNYLTGVYLLPQRRAAGAQEVLYHANGYVLETSTTNIFLLKRDRTLVTPGEGILKGVTRKRTLKLAAQFCKVEERSISLSELNDAEEMFLTSSTRQLMPVVQIGDLKIGNGQPGPFSNRLLELLRKEELDYLATVGVKPAGEHL